MVNMARKSIIEELDEKTSFASAKAKWPDTFFKDIVDAMQLPDIREAVISTGRRMGKSAIAIDNMRMPSFRGQSTDRSMRPMKNPASEIWIDSIPSIMPWHSFKGEDTPLDPKELFKSLDRSLRGEMPDASPFKARVKSEKQLRGYHKRLVRRNGALTAERDKWIDSHRQLQERNLDLTSQVKDLTTYSKALEDKVKEMKAAIADLETRKLPEKGSW